MSADREDEGDGRQLADGLLGSVLAGMADAAALDFRTFTMAAGRKGFRLEAAFWAALDGVCEREGLSRAQLLAAVLATGPEGALNATSVIRAFVAAAQNRRLEALDAIVSRDRLIALLQQAPVAAFAMDRKKRLIRANPEFLRAVRHVWGMAGELPIKTLKLTLTTPVEEIFSTLGESDAPVHSGLVIEIGHRQHKGNARVVAVPGERLEAVVGYILI